MFEHIPERLIDADDEDAQGGVPAAYAGSHRATAGCARELARLHAAVEEHLATWRAEAGTETPVVRRSPVRCLVQVGPVALTIAWLQDGRATVADGELLVVVWEGAVAGHVPRGFERSEDRGGARSATQLWEQVFVVSAESEERWGWVPAGVRTRPESSAALAGHCVQRLRAAYDAVRARGGESR